LIDRRQGEGLAYTPSVLVSRAVTANLTKASWIRRMFEEGARLKQERITRAAQRVGSELGIPGLKYGMDLNGYYGGPTRLPFLPLTADLKHEVEELLADVRN
jgi:dihydrodipicolinate synthase/N-acetylneuraminate lyase